jgi:SAM-dependent methyltransferase
MQEGSRLDTWHQLQANGLKAYREIPEASCALASRRDTQQFKRFIGRQNGLTLDIGCGIEVPGYLDKRNLEDTTGIDPLPAVGDFAPMTRLTGSGEVLPCIADWFHLVILAGTIDHVLDPAKVLSEARRVVRPAGRIVVQIGIPGSDPRPWLVKVLVPFAEHLAIIAPRPFVQGFVKALPIPEGAVDPFHFKYYTEAEIEQLFEAVHLRITRRKRLPGSTFYELRQ